MVIGPGSESYELLRGDRRATAGAAGARLAAHEDPADRRRRRRRLPARGARRARVGRPRDRDRRPRGGHPPRPRQRDGGALGRKPPRRIAMSAEIARPATVAAGAAAITSGDPEVASEISLGLTTPTVVDGPERRRAVHDRARSGSTRCSPRRSTAPRRPPDGPQPSASRSSSPPIPSGSGTRSWTRRSSSAGSRPTTRSRATPPGPLDAGDSFTQKLRLAGKSFKVDWRVRRGRAAAARALGGRGPGRVDRRRSSTGSTAEDGGTRFDYENEFALPAACSARRPAGCSSAAPGRARGAHARSSGCARCSNETSASPAARPARRGGGRQRQQRVDQHREHPGADQRDRDLGPHRVGVEADLR